MSNEKECEKKQSIPSKEDKKVKQPGSASDKVDFLLEMNKLEGTLLRQLKKEI